MAGHVVGDHVREAGFEPRLEAPGRAGADAYSVTVDLTGYHNLDQLKTLVKLAEDPTSDFAYVRFMGPDRSIVDYAAGGD